MNAPHPPKPSLLGQIGVALVTVATIVVGFVAASLLFAVLLTVGLAFAGWLWWQFRRLAREARAAQPQILEGEYTVDSTEPAEPVEPAEPARPALEAQNAGNQEPPADAPPRRSKLHKNHRASQSHD